MPRRNCQLQFVRLRRNMSLQSYSSWEEKRNTSHRLCLPGFGFMNFDRRLFDKSEPGVNRFGIEVNDGFSASLQRFERAFAELNHFGLRVWDVLRLRNFHSLLDQINAGMAALFQEFKIAFQGFLRRRNHIVCQRIDMLLQILGRRRVSAVSMRVENAFKALFRGPAAWNLLNKGRSRLGVPCVEHECPRTAFADELTEGSQCDTSLRYNDFRVSPARRWQAF